MVCWLVERAWSRGCGALAVPRRFEPPRNTGRLSNGRAGAVEDHYACHSCIPRRARNRWLAGGCRRDRVRGRERRGRLHRVASGQPLRDGGRRSGSADPHRLGCRQAPCRGHARAERDPGCGRRRRTSPNAARDRRTPIGATWRWHASRSRGIAAVAFIIPDGWLRRHRLFSAGRRARGDGRSTRRNRRSCWGHVRRGSERGERGGCPEAGPGQSFRRGSGPACRSGRGFGARRCGGCCGRRDLERRAQGRRRRLAPVTARVGGFSSSR